jgi:hypothetical protein
MLKKISLFLGFFLLAFPFPSHSFDCNNPDFGARIENLNKNGYFIKYLEKGGVSYYNYTGPCRLDMHNHTNPSIHFAFIQNELYARIVTIPKREGYTEDIRDRMEKNVPSNVGTQPYTMKQEGDWWIYQWSNDKDSLKYKVKINARTNEGKSVCYYEPLRTKLPNFNEEDDPVSLDR